MRQSSHGVHGAGRAALVFAVLLASVATATVAAAQGPKPSTAGGTLTITGAQAGAEVYVDGELVGPAPVSPIPLTPGNHTLRVTRPGFTEFTEVVRIRKGKGATIAVEMMAVSMVLTVRTEPPVAQVFVDEKFAGESPIDLDLVEGAHALKITKQDFRDALRQVDAHAGQTDTLTINLEPIPRAEMHKDAPVDEDAWYQQPSSWLLIGGGAALVATGVILAVVLSSGGGSEVSSFCKGSDTCVRVP